MSILNILLEIGADGLGAGIAALGFSVVTNSPKESFVYAPILAAIGHAFRLVLIKYIGVEIAIATFLAAMLIGFLGLAFAYRGRRPVQVFSFPALLPMIPGTWGYRSLLGLINFMKAGEESGSQFLPEFQSNAIMALMIMFALGVGVAIPIFLFGKKSFNMEKEFLNNK